MNLYKIDEGVTHWIFARNKAQALRLFRAWLRDVELRCAFDIKEAFEGLSIERERRGKRFTFHHDKGETTQTVAAWIAERGKKAEYFACSEY